jgi:hypothetical protein
VKRGITCDSATVRAGVCFKMWHNNIVSFIILCNTSLTQRMRAACALILQLVAAGLNLQDAPDTHILHIIIIYYISCDHTKSSLVPRPCWAVAAAATPSPCSPASDKRGRSVFRKPVIPALAAAMGGAARARRSGHTKIQPARSHSLGGGCRNTRVAGPAAEHECPRCRCHRLAQSGG